MTADLRFALRRLRKSPGYVAATIAMLALGVGLAVGMFSVVRGVLLASLPYPDGERAVEVRAVNPRQDVQNSSLTAAEAVQLDAASDVFDAFGYYTWGGLSVFDGEHPREFSIAIVGAGFFPALGMQPELGRWFADEDFATRSDAVVLSHAEWQRLLGGDPDAIGREIDTSDGRMRVIGVMPAEFAFPADDVGAWRPWFTGRLQPDQPWYWNARFVDAVARLRTDAAPAAVEAQLAAVAAQVRERYSLPDAGWALTPVPVLDALVGDLRGVLWGSFAIALLVLLIGCANVAILLDARQVAQQHEQALTQALGASRGRVFRAMLLEIGLLAFAAVGAGLLFAHSAVDLLREYARDTLPRSDAIAIDAHTVLFALALGAVLPFVAALAGSLRVRADAAQAIRAGGRGVVAGSRARRRWLPALGIALSTISLIAASALLLSLYRLQQVDPGFRSDNVHALQFYRGGGPDVVRPFAAQLLETLRALPGVEQAAVTTVAPLATHGGFSIDLQVRGRSEPESFQVGLRRVSPDYLDLLGIPLLAGRGIEAADREGAPAVAVISRELARRVFGDASPLDQVIGLPLGQGERVDYRIVGVMDDIRNDGLRAPPAPELLIPFARDPHAALTFLVRTSAPQPGLAEQITAALWAIDPREAVTRQYMLGDDVDAQLAATRWFARTIAAFALAALGLAALGVYAVAALQQQRRIAEFGLRLAVGARPRALAAQILRDTATTIAVGIVLGAAGAWAALRLLQPQLFGLDGAQPAVVAAGMAVLAAIALAAALLPALRAARTDPMTALRYQ